MNARMQPLRHELGFKPLDLDELAKAGEMMELLPDGQHVRIIGVNKTYLLDDLIPSALGLEDTLGEKGLIITIFGYMIVSIIGTLGNALVLYAILSRPKMRVMRHIFIGNLAVSDFILCSITAPLTLLEVLGDPIGTVGIMCKLLPALQATSVYVSTLNITAIALERYQVIVYSTNPTPHRKFVIACIVTSIWLLSFALSMPFVIFRTTLRFGIPKIRVIFSCTEVWPTPYGRAIYSIFCMFFQYYMPIIVIGAAHARIVRKLDRRYINRPESSPIPRNGYSSHAEESEVQDLARTRRKGQKRRQRKTNLMLFMIALIFALCWLPINVINIIADFSTDLYTENVAIFQPSFVVAHLIAMSSAVANPILYGFLNENFRSEFRSIFMFWVRLLFCGRTFGMEKDSTYVAGATSAALKDRSRINVTAL